MMQLTDSQVIAIKRKRGELSLSIGDLARQTGVNRWTLSDILSNDHRHVSKATYQNLTNWLIDTYAAGESKTDYETVKGVK
ncbi:MULTISPECIES: helix-turn-helix transcriptional regulator [Limosilactobacillus]|uniref:Helix-turn-helix transcriptional regulator n=1 Tax=Limosilactobacillus allomucosae TaxID=3142938 RepID=A0AAU7C4A5_9LACO|nr:helix-turn-helix transcriptional regulator [Limosilactobacillus mucosae]MDC2843651.1 helix-turn-helix transcriptional regulator [Limosilactobacillus mucosae]